MSEQFTRDEERQGDPLSRSETVGDDPRAAARNPLPSRGRSVDAQPAPAGYGYGSEVLTGDEIHLSEYVKVVYKRRWTVLTTFLIVVVSVCIYTFTATPIYESRVQILIEKEATNVVSFKEAFEQNQITDDYYQTQYKILQSRALARRTIDTLKLWDHPQFNPTPDDSLTVRKIAVAPVRLIAGWFKSTRPSEAPLVDETKIQSATIDRFLAS